MTVRAALRHSAPATAPSQFAPRRSAPYVHSLQLASRHARAEPGQAVGDRAAPRQARPCFSSPEEGYEDMEEVKVPGRSPQLF